MIWNFRQNFGMIVPSKRKVGDKMKKLVSMVLTAALCGSMLVAVPFAVCYADEPSSGESSSSTTTGEETDKKEPENPIAPQDAQRPGGDMA